jgi:putative ABC transport system ATP-binding protein
MSVPAIIMNNVKKSYGSGETRVEVLKQISLEINSGESVALIGRSGSGKSTLLSLLAGLDRPDAGDIFVEGENIALMTEKELTQFRASKMGIVFQQFHLVSTLTAIENVMLPLEILKIPDAFHKANNLLQSVGLSHRRDHLPSQLSGGESQRVAIARALATNPGILFADEPSGNLDEDTGSTVMDLLFQMVEKTKTTLILVTHDQELAQRCRRIVHLEHGRFV